MFLLQIWKEITAIKFEQWNPTAQPMAREQSLKLIALL